MRFIYIFALLVGLFPLAGMAQVGDQSRPEGALERTVLGQIEAFRSGDYDAAFDYASDDIKKYFGSSEAFGAMIGQGFAMVIDPKNVKFLENRPDGRAVWQKVLIRTREGEAFVLDYQLVPAREGWKINAVLPVRDAGVPA